MLPPKYKGTPTRILDLDLENRPLSYAGQDFTFSEITAIACKWIGKPRSTHVWLLGVDPPEAMLENFREMYEECDIATGHNVIKHDMRILNGAMLEYGLGPLPARLIQDTYAHLKRRSGVSASQESLAAMLDIPRPKVSMNQADWRSANRLTPEGIAKTRARVVGDVLQHELMRDELIARQWLKPPRRWSS